jgi:hypothetical protein
VRAPLTLEEILLYTCSQKSLNSAFTPPVSSLPPRRSNNSIKDNTTKILNNILSTVIVFNVDFKYYETDTENVIQKYGENVSH